MVYALFGGVALSTALANVLTKIYRKRIEDEDVKDNLYYLVMIVIALLYFAILSGFNLRVNLTTLAFSAVYAVVAYALATFNMKAIDHAELVTVSVFSNAGGLLWNTVWGVTFFGEPLTFGKVTGGITVITAVLIAYLAEKRERCRNIRGILYCCGVFMVNGCGQLVVKLYTLAENAEANSLMCFYTNIFLIPFVILILHKRSSLKKVFFSIYRINIKPVVILVTALIFLNTATILGMFLIKEVEFIVYSVLEKALGIMATAILSSLCLNERITLVKIISILLLAAAVLITIL